MPPLVGYKVPEADLILTRANYPKNHNLREIKKEYKLVWCGKDYALFAKESFLNNNPQIKTLKYYTPYTLLPKDDEGKKLALSEIDLLLRLEPDFYEGLRDKGRLLIDLKRDEEAIDFFKRALKIKESGELYNDLGVCYFNLQKYEEALNCYYNAMKLSPRDIIPRMSYAYTAMQMGNIDDAIVVLEDLNRAYPTFYPAYRLHYQAWGRKGDIEKAKEILRKIPKELRTQDEKDLLNER
jgi:tetratricopeptide (TPR) repeat protein